MHSDASGIQLSKLLLFLVHCIVSSASVSLCVRSFVTICSTSSLNVLISQCVHLTATQTTMNVCTKFHDPVEVEIFQS